MNAALQSWCNEIKNGEKKWEGEKPQRGSDVGRGGSTASLMLTQQILCKKTTRGTALTTSTAHISSDDLPLNYYWLAAEAVCTQLITTGFFCMSQPSKKLLKTVEQSTTLRSSSATDYNKKGFLWREFFFFFFLSFRADFAYGAHLSRDVNGRYTQQMIEVTHPRRD